MAFQQQEQPKSEKPLSALISDMTSDVATLVRKEFELAKIETKEELSRAAKAGGMMGAAGFAGYMAVLLLSFAVVFLLDLVLPRWLAFLIVAVVYAIVGFVLFRQGQARMKHVNPVPEQTVETIKEDVEWLKAQTK